MKEFERIRIQNYAARVL